MNRMFWSGERRIHRRRKFKTRGMSHREIMQMKRRRKNKYMISRLQPNVIEVGWSKRFLVDFKDQIRLGDRKR